MCFDCLDEECVRLVQRGDAVLHATRRLTSQFELSVVGQFENGFPVMVCTHKNKPCCRRLHEGVNVFARRHEFIGFTSREDATFVIHGW